MAKKSAKQIAQFKHLRFIDTEALALGDAKNTILNHGGFTLAFKIFDVSALADQELATAYNEHRFILRYAYSECALTENYNRARGRAIAHNRLRQLADDWMGTFGLDHEALTALNTPKSPEGVLETINVVGGEPGEVDLIGVEEAIAEQLIRNFLDAEQDIMFTCSEFDPMGEYLVQYKGQWCIDSTVLETGADADDEDDEDAMGSIADSAMAAMNHIDAASKLLEGVLENNSLSEEVLEALKGANDALGLSRFSINEIAVVATMTDDDEDDEDYESGVDDDDEDGSEDDDGDDLSEDDDGEEGDDADDEEENDAQRQDREAGTTQG